VQVDECDMKEDVKKSLIFTRELSRIYRLGDSEVIGINRVGLDIAKRRSGGT